MSTKSKPKDNRERLFWKDKPSIRPAGSADLKWFKVAKRLEHEDIEDTYEQYLIDTLSNYQEALVIEDSNHQFASKFGPVGFVGALTNGYVYEPHVEWFPWASSRNKVRGTVAFFQKFRYRDLGVVIVHALEPDFFRRMKKYVPLYYVGKVPSGDPLARGDDHIFYMKCRGAYVLSI